MNGGGGRRRMERGEWVMIACSDLANARGKPGVELAVLRDIYRRLLLQLDGEEVDAVERETLEALVVETAMESAEGRHGARIALLAGAVLRELAPSGHDEYESPLISSVRRALSSLHSSPGGVPARTSKLLGFALAFLPQWTPAADAAPVLLIREVLMHRAETLSSAVNPYETLAAMATAAVRVGFLSPKLETVLALEAESALRSTVGGDTSTLQPVLTLGRLVLEAREVAADQSSRGTSTLGYALVALASNVCTRAGAGVNIPGPTLVETARILSVASRSGDVSKGAAITSLERLLSSCRNSRGEVAVATLTYLIDLNASAMSRDNVSDIVRRLLSVQLTSQYIRYPTAAYETLHFAAKNCHRLDTDFPGLLSECGPALIRAIAWAPDRFCTALMRLLPVICASSAGLLRNLNSILDLPIVALAISMEYAGFAYASEDAGGGGGGGGGVVSSCDVMELMDGSYMGSTAEEIQSARMTRGWQGQVVRLFKDIADSEVGDDAVPKLLYDAGFISQLTRMVSSLHRCPRLMRASELSLQATQMLMDWLLDEASMESLAAVLSILLRRLWGKAWYPTHSFSQHMEAMCLETVNDAILKYPDLLGVLREHVLAALTDPREGAGWDIRAQLCWGVGEGCARLQSEKDLWLVEELLEGLEQVLHATRQGWGGGGGLVAQGQGADDEAGSARTACIALAAVAKLAVAHPSLLNRAQLILRKEANVNVFTRPSRQSDVRLESPLRAAELLLLIHDAETRPLL